jgi:hypothetical protein
MSSAQQYGRGGTWQNELASCLYGADGTMTCGVVQQPQPFAFQVVAFDDDKNGGCTKGPVANADRYTHLTASACCAASLQSRVS